MGCVLSRKSKHRASVCDVSSNTERSKLRFACGEGTFEGQHEQVHAACQMKGVGGVLKRYAASLLGKSAQRTTQGGKFKYSRMPYHGLF